MFVGFPNRERLLSGQRITRGRSRVPYPIRCKPTNSIACAVSNDNFASARNALTNVFSSSAKEQGKNENYKNTYNSRYSLVVTDPTTNQPLSSLTRGERTGSRVLY